MSNFGTADKNQHPFQAEAKFCDTLNKNIAEGYSLIAILHAITILAPGEWSSLLIWLGKGQLRLIVLYGLRDCTNWMATLFIPRRKLT